MGGRSELDEMVVLRQLIILTFCSRTGHKTVSIGTTYIHQFHVQAFSFDTFFFLELSN